MGSLAGLGTAPPAARVGEARDAAPHPSVPSCSPCVPRLHTAQLRLTFSACLAKLTRLMQSLRNNSNRFLQSQVNSPYATEKGRPEDLTAECGATHVESASTCTEFV